MYDKNSNQWIQKDTQSTDTRQLSLIIDDTSVYITYNESEKIVIYDITDDLNLQAEDLQPNVEWLNNNVKKGSLNVGDVIGINGGNNQYLVNNKGTIRFFWDKYCMSHIQLSLSRDINNKNNVINASYKIYNMKHPTNYHIDDNKHLISPNYQGSGLTQNVLFRNVMYGIKNRVKDPTKNRMPMEVEEEFNDNVSRLKYNITNKLSDYNGGLKHTDISLNLNNCNQYIRSTGYKKIPKDYQGILSFPKFPHRNRNKPTNCRVDAPPPKLPICKGTAEERNGRATTEVNVYCGEEIITKWGSGPSALGKVNIGNCNYAARYPPPRGPRRWGWCPPKYTDFSKNEALTRCSEKSDCMYIVCDKNDDNCGLFKNNCVYDEYECDNNNSENIIYKKSCLDNTTNTLKDDGILKNTSLPNWHQKIQFEYKDNENESFSNINNIKEGRADIGINDKHILTEDEIRQLITKNLVDNNVLYNINLSGILPPINDRAQNIEFITQTINNKYKDILNSHPLSVTQLSPINYPHVTKDIIKLILTNMNIDNITSLEKDTKIGYELLRDLEIQNIDDYVDLHTVLRK